MRTGNENIRQMGEDVRRFAEKIRNKASGVRKWHLYLILIIFVLIYYYIALPPIHYASSKFWLFLLIITLGIFLIEVIFKGAQSIGQNSFKGFFKGLKGPMKLLTMFWGAVILVFVVASIVTTPMFLSKQYSSMIEVETADFAEDFPKANTDKIPLVDKDTAQRLGNRHLGHLSELVSQFVVAEDYTQINIKDHPYRVSPLEYADFWRWVNNRSQGIPNYIQVDMVTGEVELKTPTQPIKYSYSEPFNRNVLRRLRFKHPFAMFGSPTFEVDDEGNPYYVATTYRKRFLFKEPEANGLILLNAMTGETECYKLDEIPAWVDRIYSAELIMHQIEQRGLYKNGYWNSKFAKEGVMVPTEGYNYLPMEGDIYLYTGMTSVVSDESNVGFVLINMRSKETKFYPLSAADEMSAMRSAEGSVQEKGYRATFPLLMNFDGDPMYILSLKDGAGLVKEYALVDAQNYQKVYTASSINQLLTAYEQDRPVSLEEVEDETFEEITGLVSGVEAVVVEGNTVYYILIDDNVYRAPITINENLPFLETGTEVELEVSSSSGVVSSIEW